MKCEVVCNENFIFVNNVVFDTKEIKTTYRLYNKFKNKFDIKDALIVILRYSDCIIVKIILYNGNQRFSVPDFKIINTEENEKVKLSITYNYNNLFDDYIEEENGVIELTSKNNNHITCRLLNAKKRS